MKYQEALEFIFDLTSQELADADCTISNFNKLQDSRVVLLSFKSKVEAEVREDFARVLEHNVRYQALTVDALIEMIKAELDTIKNEVMSEPADLYDEYRLSGKRKAFQIWHALWVNLNIWNKES